MGASLKLSFQPGPQTEKTAPFLKTAFQLAPEFVVRLVSWETPGR
jgi:hypothetical protein